MIKNKKVLMTDRSWPLMLDVIEDLSHLCKNDGISILFLSERHKSSVRGNLEIINIFDIPQKKSMKELQGEYDFSLFKCIPNSYIVDFIISGSESYISPYGIVR